jgi:collagenase-like PrtC family protease
VTKALELLAPARNADFGIEAINHGADAVYIGGPAFGARANAGNSVDDIERLAAYAHRFHARVFVALNTILRDDELDEARPLVWQVYEAGADALIVQDMGLLELDLPPIQLHASHAVRHPHAGQGDASLQDVGFSQMVLARELSLRRLARAKELCEAAETPGAPIEFFVHGALCVAYSGQCYISHAHTGRSANRGECSQACRLPYTLDRQRRVASSPRQAPFVDEGQRPERQPARADRGRHQLVQDRGTAQGSRPTSRTSPRTTGSCSTPFWTTLPGTAPVVEGLQRPHLHAAARKDLQSRR